MYVFLKNIKKRLVISTKVRAYVFTKIIKKNEKNKILNKKYVMYNIFIHL